MREDTHPGSLILITDTNAGGESFFTKY